LTVLKLCAFLHDVQERSIYLEYFVLFLLIFTLKILLAISTCIKIYRSTAFRIQRYKLRTWKRLELSQELLAVIVFINGTKSKQVCKCRIQWVFDISVLEEAVTSFDFRKRQMYAILFQIDTRSVLCQSATCWELGLAGCSTVLRCPKSSLSCSTRQLRLSLPASSWGCRSRGATFLYQRKFNENDLVYLDC
jgi:hypothetical protein